MQVNPGYNKTEAGIIPEDWDIKPLGDLVRSGPKNGYSGRTSDDPTKTPTLSLSATTSGRLVLNDDTVKYLAVAVPQDSDLFLRADDVLVQRSNTIELVGTTAVYLGRSGVYVYPDLMMRLRFADRTTAHWYWRYANSPSGRRYFMSVAAGSTGSMPKLSGAKLRDMPIPVPRMAEQEAITEALSDADALMEGLTQLIAKKREIKQGAMQELLTGQKRLPGFSSKSRYKQTEVGAIPEEWIVSVVEDIALITTGAKNTQDRVEDGEYPFFVRSQTVERINSYSFDGEAILTAGDGVGTGKVFHYINGKFDTHQRVYRLSNFGDGVSGYFFFLYFSSHFYSRIMQMTAKSSVDSVRREMIARMQIPLPPTKAEQEAIAAVLSEMDAEIVGLEAKSAKLQQIKQGMMQELLTGRTRLVSSGGTHA